MAEGQKQTECAETGCKNVTGSAHFFFHLELLSSIIVGKYHREEDEDFGMEPIIEFQNFYF